MTINGIILSYMHSNEMKSLVNKRANVCFEVLDKPIIEYVYDALSFTTFDNIFNICDLDYENIKSIVPNINNIKTDEILKLKKVSHDGCTLIIRGDALHVDSKTIDKIIDFHKDNKNIVTILSNNSSDDCIKELIDDLNVTMIINNDVLLKYIDNITSKTEVCSSFLKQLLDYIAKEKINISSFYCNNTEKFIKIDSRMDLVYATKFLQTKINTALMLKGISIVDPSTTYIGVQVEVGNDTTIYPNTHIYGKSVIGVNCNIGPNVYIKNSIIDNDAVLRNTYIENKTILK